MPGPLATTPATIARGAQGTPSRRAPRQPKAECAVGARLPRDVHLKLVRRLAASGEKSGSFVVRAIVELLEREAE